jgi:hypothetical protein
MACLPAASSRRPGAMQFTGKAICGMVVISGALA